MKYKILMFDGHAVSSVLYDRICYCDGPPELLPHETTIDMLVKKILWRDNWRDQCSTDLRFGGG